MCGTWWWFWYTDDCRGYIFCTIFCSSGPSNHMLNGVSLRGFTCAFTIVWAAWEELFIILY